MSLERDIASMTESVGLKLYDTAVLHENEDVIYRVSVVSSNVVDGKKEGVTLDQCVALTNLISPLLDVTPPVSGNYRLEVSSAGIERKITTLEQFILSVGENIALTLLSKEKLKGVLQKVEGSKIFLESDNELKEIEFGTISKAKTYFEW
ncbi:MAG: ribosome maturation factor [Thiovulaceae bacterium]|nr:ribosome maturation factor [Sulfurimonadaceae bacterium]MDD3816804.1 ribosome maturation factor [Sulfurimonadaceae bacterium]